MTRGLLARMAAREQRTRGSSLERSVLDHLGALLNTRQGSSSLDPHYGVPDITDALHDFPRGAVALQRELEATIRRGESRLESVVVRPLPIDQNALVLRFEVVGQLRDGPILRFQTEVSCGGQIKLR